MATLKPMPVATKISAPFWQALKENQLKIQQCNSCDGWVFFPRNHCSHCLAHDLEWKQVSGEGILYSYTLTRIPTMPEFADEMPQALAVVELAQGVRINTTLIDVAEQDIKVGMAVKPVFDKVSSDGETLLRFTSTNNAGGIHAYIDPLNGLESNDKGQVQVPVSNLAALYALADNKFTEWSNKVVVDQALINAFAELSGDDYWLHTDPERAKTDSPFKTTIAHGSLVQVLQSRLTIGLPFEVVGFKTMINYGSNRLRFPAPVPAGSTIHGRSKVKDISISHKGVQLTLEINIHVVGNDKPSVINDLVILYR
ncbi:OB-fold domain-containing protein [Colwellia sp. PAMC 21821]|uniref:bifunctional OB-fold nucleic acid binding domain-containing protein/MaoC family dehydratase n=1 Tax=Colwellia sp. PAMC 21821 TaxID=1816219 RepID=UPI0009BF2F59|nr:OB-fold domain-containing protein [Colwellia sp. PAMC 21821]ARD46135.1 acyl dehydratase [Colwellia sp. PAMC 21821]